MFYYVNAKPLAWSSISLLESICFSYKMDNLLTLRGRSLAKLIKEYGKMCQKLRGPSASHNGRNTWIQVGPASPNEKRHLAAPQAHRDDARLPLFLRRLPTSLNDPPKSSVLSCASHAPKLHHHHRNHPNFCPHFSLNHRSRLPTRPAKRLLLLALRKLTIPASACHQLQSGQKLSQSWGLVSLMRLVAVVDYGSVVAVATVAHAYGWWFHEP